MRFMRKYTKLPLTQRSFRSFECLLMKISRAASWRAYGWRLSSFSYRRA